MLPKSPHGAVVAAHGPQAHGAMKTKAASHKVPRLPPTRSTVPIDSDPLEGCMPLLATALLSALVGTPVGGQDNQIQQVQLETFVQKCSNVINMKALSQFTNVPIPLNLPMDDRVLDIILKTLCEFPELVCEQCEAHGPRVLAILSQSPLPRSVVSRIRTVLSPILDGARGLCQHLLNSPRNSSEYQAIIKKASTGAIITLLQVDGVINQILDTPKATQSMGLYESSLQESCHPSLLSKIATVPAWSRPVCQAIATQLMCATVACVHYAEVERQLQSAMTDISNIPLIVPSSIGGLCRIRPVDGAEKFANGIANALTRDKLNKRGTSYRTVVDGSQPPQINPHLSDSIDAWVQQIQVVMTTFPILKGTPLQLIVDEVATNGARLMLCARATEDMGNLQSLLCAFHYAGENSIHTWASNQPALYIGDVSDLIDHRLSIGERLAAFSGWSTSAGVLSVYARPTSSSSSSTCTKHLYCLTDTCVCLSLTLNPKP